MLSNSHTSLRRSATNLAIVSASDDLFCVSTFGAKKPRSIPVRLWLNQRWWNWKCEIPWISTAEFVNNLWNFCVFEVVFIVSISLSFLPSSHTLPLLINSKFRRLLLFYQKQFASHLRHHWVCNKTRFLCMMSLCVRCLFDVSSLFPEPETWIVEKRCVPSEGIAIFLLVIFAFYHNTVPCDLLFFQHYSN